ncbi:TPA: hypothetical protein QCY38_003827 [Bacillus toyonensis]|uniref:hypothetical protein n=1 Tax=Bacillus toyonensis TaxID=155322 RepID=UPI000BF9A248|nr:hypothetical protein [Bacillus toyonensis]PGC09941.1 hypothetical protein COL99_24435 [Bacillus toyonensis]PGC78811.1 hypothetical protein COM28_19335 [Bacillus toyonensis]HDR7950135.1 hypothetical protein [Bacillus toyonensis]
MIISFHGNRDQNDKDYKKFVYLVEDIYQECIDSGYTRDGAAGKTKYELEPMAIEETSKILLYIELSYYFAEQDLKDSFEMVYQKLRNVTSLLISIRELPVKINISSQYRSEIDVKIRKIIRYFEDNVFNDDRDSA